MAEPALHPRPTLSARAPALRGAAVHSVACAMPEGTIETAAIAERLGVTEDWIVSRTGVRRRHVAAPGERLDDIAARAGALALERAGVDAADVDLILVATNTKEEVTPNAAPLVAGQLGAARAGAFDVGMGCAGFISALGAAAGLVEAGRAETVLLIGAEVMSHFLDYDDKRTAAIFGDGAAALVMTATDGESAIGPIVLGTDSQGAAWIHCGRDDGLLRMDGHNTFKYAVPQLCTLTVQAAEAAGLSLDELDLFVYHQANIRILAAVGERLELPPERVVRCIERSGNVSAATIPIALAAADEEERLHDGDRVLLASFGAGLSWGATVVEWGRPA